MPSLATDPRVESLVNRIARRHCGRGVEFNDLVGAGMLAACQAVERFDPSKGSLTSFLGPRIHGAIRDAARRDSSAIMTPRGCPAKRTIGDSQGDGQWSLADLVTDHRGHLFVDVDKIVAELPEEQAEVIRTLYGFDGPPLSLEATAEAIGRTTADVDRIEASALATLRRRLADLDYSRPALDEEFRMSRLNGFHAEPTTETATVETDGKTCPSCNRRYKNPKFRRCYHRDCPASGYAASAAKASRVVTVDATGSIAGQTGSLADEIQVMTLMTGLGPAARLRVLAWVQSAFGA